MKELKYKYNNFNKLKEETLGNEVIFKKLVQLFLGSVNEYIDLFDGDLESKDYTTLYGVTHKIIPSIRMFGISELEPILMKLESDYRNEIELSSIIKDIDSSLKIFKQVKLELDNELKKL